MIKMTPSKYIDALAINKNERFKKRLLGCLYANNSSLYKTATINLSGRVAFCLPP